MSRTRFRLLALVVMLALFAAACGGGDDDSASAGDGTAGEPADDGGGGDGEVASGDGAGAADDSDEPAGDDGEPEPAPDLSDFNGGKPSVEVPDGPPPDELVTIDLIEGDGEEVVDGSTVEVHYVGVAWSTGEEFDSSWNSGLTFDVQLGQGQVIAGWDRGLVGMREGGRRELRIPPDLAYGPEGSPPVIGPDETLIFVVDVVDSVSPPDPSEEPELVYPDEAPGDLVIEDLEIGEGAVAEVGDVVFVNFVLGVLDTRETLVSTWELGQTFPFDLGGDRVDVPVGLTRGVEGMAVGGLRRLVVPPGLGFTQQNDEVGPDDTLVFVVELVEVR